MFIKPLLKPDKLVYITDIQTTYRLLQKMHLDHKSRDIIKTVWKELPDKHSRGNSQKK